MSDNNDLLSLEDFLSEDDDKFLGNEPVNPTTGLESNNDNLLTTEEFQSAIGETGDMDLDLAGGTPGDIRRTWVQPEEFEDVHLRIGEDPFRARAEKQPWTEQAMHAVYQAGVGEVVGGTIESVGALWDLVNGDMFRENSDYGNALMDIGESLREHTQEVAPIYQLNPEEAWNPGDSGWWFSHFPSVVSSVSMMIPGYGAVRAVGLLGKAAKALGKTNKIVKALTSTSKRVNRFRDAVVGGVTSRYAENFREAAGTYKEVLAKAEEAFQDDDEVVKFLHTEEGKEFAEQLGEEKDPEVIKKKAAEWIASKSATVTFRSDWANVVFDIMQFGALLKPVKGTRATGKTRGRVRAAQDKTLSTPKGAQTRLGKAAGAMVPVGKGVLGAGTEGIEEGINYISSREGARKGDLLLGNKDNTSFGDRLLGYLGDDEMHASALWGFIGGAGMSTIGAIKNMKEVKKQRDRKISEIENRTSIMRSLQAERKEAVDRGATAEEVQEIEEKMAFQLGMNAAKNGTVDLLLENLNDSKIDEVLAESLGLDPTAPEYKEKKQMIINRVEKVEKAYNKHVNKMMNNRFADLEDYEVNQLAEAFVNAEVGLGVYEDLIKSLDKKISDREAEEFLDMPETAYTGELLNARRTRNVTVKTVQSEKKILEAQKKKVKELEESPDDIDTNVLESEKEILKQQEEKVKVLEDLAEAQGKKIDLLDEQAKEELSEEEYKEQSEFLERETNNELEELKHTRVNYKINRDAYKDRLNSLNKKLSGEKVTTLKEALDQMKAQNSKAMYSRAKHVINDLVTTLEALDGIEAEIEREGEMTDDIRKLIKRKNRELVNKGQTRDNKSKQLELDLAEKEAAEAAGNTPVSEIEPEITDEEARKLEEAQKAIDQIEAEEEAARSKDGTNSDEATEPIQDLADIIGEVEEEVEEVEEIPTTREQIDAEKAAIKEQLKKNGLTASQAIESLSSSIDQFSEEAAKEAALEIIQELQDYIDKKAKEATEKERKELEAKQAVGNIEPQGGNNENGATGEDKTSTKASEGAKPKVVSMKAFKPNVPQFVKLQEKDGTWTDFLDANGNRMPYRLFGGFPKYVKESELPEGADAQQLYYFEPVGAKSTKGKELLAKPAVPYQRDGENVYLVWPRGGVPVNELVNFEFLNKEGNLTETDEVTLVLQPNNHIFVYHTNSEKPIAAFMPSQYGVYKDIKKHLTVGNPVKVTARVNSDAAEPNNIKSIGGESVKMPISSHGDPSKITIGYADSSVGGNIVWSNTDNEAEGDPERSTVAPAGTVYMRLLRPDGRAVPIRLQTANISDSIAREIISYFMNEPETAKDSAGAFLAFQNNTDQEYNADRPLTALAISSDMIRIPHKSGKVIGIRYVSRKGHNNFLNALTGKEFYYREYNADGTSTPEMSSKESGITLTTDDIADVLVQKKFNVNKELMNTPGKFKVGNTTYNSYNEMLDKEGILTTDVSATQPFAFGTVDLVFTPQQTEVAETEENTKSTTPEQTDDTQKTSPTGDPDQLKRSIKLKLYEHDQALQDLEEFEERRDIQIARAIAGERFNTDELELHKGQGIMWKKKGGQSLDGFVYALANDETSPFFGEDEQDLKNEIKGFMSQSISSKNYIKEERDIIKATIESTAQDYKDLSGKDIMDFDFEITEEEAVPNPDPTPDVTPDVTPETEGPIQIDSDEEFDFKLVNGQITGEALSQREKDWFSDMFGDDAIEYYAVQKYVLLSNGRKAFGAYANGMATIGAGAIAGTVYHEAFHMVTDLALTTKEKEQLYRAAEKKYGKKPVRGDGSLEEDLANDFERYMISRNKKGIVPAILRLYDRIRIFLERFIGADADILKFYEGVRKGKYKGMNSKTEVENFTTEAELKEKPGYRPDAKEEAAEMLDYLFIEELEAAIANKEIDMTLDDVLGISDEPGEMKERKEIIVKYIEKTRERLKVGAKKLQESDHPKKKATGKNLENLVSDEEWNDKLDPETGEVDVEGWKTILANKLKDHGIAIKFKNQEVRLEETDPQAIEDEFEESGRGHEDRIHGQSAALHDTKKDISNILRIKMSFIPKVHKNGKPVLGKYYSKKRFEDFNEIYSAAQTKLVGVPENKLEKKMEELSKKNTKIASLWNEYQTWSPQLKAMFKSQMAAQQKRFFTVVADKKGNVKIIETNRQGIELQIMEEWKENRHNTDIFLSGANEGKIDRLAAQEIEKEFNKLNQLAKDKNIEEYAKVADGLLRAVGIELTATEMDELTLRHINSDTGEKAVGSLSRIHELMAGSRSSFRILLKGINNKGGLINGENPYESENVGFFRNLAKYVREIRTDLYGGTFINGEGKQVFSINYNTFLSKKMNKLQDPQEFAAMLDMFYKDSFYAPSPEQRDFLLDLLENDTVRDNMQIFTFDTLKASDKTSRADGVAFDSLTPESSYIARFLAYHNGNDTKFALFNTGTKSDKGESIYVKLPRIKAANRNLGVWLSGSQTSRVSDVRENVIEIMKKTAYQEIARIKQTVKELEVLSKDELIENLHTKNKNGLHFIHLPTLNDIMLDEEGDLISDNEIAEKLDDAIAEYVDYLVEAGKKDMIAAGVVYEENGELMNKSLPSQATNGSDKVTRIVEGYLLNDIAWRNEMQKFQYGDLAFYKTEKVKTETGYFLDVTKDASKRGYQMITPGTDHVTKESKDGYGKSKTFNMAIIKDIDKKASKAYTISVAQLFDPNISISKLEKMLEMVGKKPAFKVASKDGGMKEEFEKMPDKRKQAIKIASDYTHGINKTDAQGFQTLGSFKESLEGRGIWGDLHDEAYDKYWSKGLPGEKKHQALLLQPLKTFYYGPRELTLKDAAGNTYTKVIYEQVKHSTFPLLPSMTKLFPELDKLRRRMEATGEFKGQTPIDVVNFDSAIKVGAYGIKEWTELDNLVVRKMDSANERTPLTIPTRKKTPKDGSQFAKLIIQNIEDTDSYTLNGTDISGKDLKSLYNDVYYARIEKAALELENKIGWTAYSENQSPENLHNLLMNIKQEILAQLKERDMPDIYEDALKLIKTAEEFEYTLPLDFPPFAKKFEIVLASLYKSKVLTQTFPGTSLVQVAEFGTDFDGELKWMRPKHKVVDGNKVNDGLEPAEAAIPFKLAEKLGLTNNDYIKEDGTIDFKKFNEDAKNDKVNKDLFNFIAYRIPTQEKDMMAIFKIVKVLPPNSGSSFILPGEVTTQMGSDFDVDKLFLQFATSKKTLDKDGRTVYEKPGISKKLLQEYINKGVSEGGFNPAKLAENEAVMNNLLFDIRWGILSSKHHSQEVLAPLDTDTYKNLLQQFSDLGIGSDESARYFGGTHTDVYQEDINRDAKMLVGMFSTHSVAHQAAQLTNLSLKAPIEITYIREDGTIATKTGMQMNGIRGFDGQYISKYISENQSAALDNAKDPITGKLNINKFTANVISLLNRAGYNNTVATHFVNQPVIRQLYKEFQLNEDEDINVLASKVKDFFNLHGTDANKEDRFEISNKNLEANLIPDFTNEAYELHQLQVLEDFVNLYAKGRELSKINKIFSPDRISDMSSLSAISQYEKTHEIVTADMSAFLFDDPLTTDSYKRMKGFYDFAIKRAEKLMSEFFPYNSSAFLNGVENVAFYLGKDNGALDKKGIDQVNNALVAWNMTKNPALNATLTPANYEKIFFSDEYLARRLVLIKNKYNLKEHGFLKFIKEDERNAKEGRSIKLLKFNSTAKFTNTQKTLMQDRWKELMHPTQVKDIVRDANPTMPTDQVEQAAKEIRAAAKDLILYTIMSTGFQSGPRSFIELVPITAWTNTTINMRKFMKTETHKIRNAENYNYFEQASDQIIRNRSNMNLVSSIEGYSERPDGKIKADAYTTNVEFKYMGQNFYKYYVKIDTEDGPKLFRASSGPNNLEVDVTDQFRTMIYEPVQMLGEYGALHEYNAFEEDLKSVHPDNQDTEYSSQTNKAVEVDTDNMAKEAHKKASEKALNENQILMKTADEVANTGKMTNMEVIADWQKFKTMNPDINAFREEILKRINEC